MSAYHSIRKGCLVLCILLCWVAGAPASDGRDGTPVSMDEAPDGPFPAIDRLSMAFGHYRLGQYAEAAALLETFLAGSPAPPDEEAARFLLGDSYFGAFDRNPTGNSQRALDAYRRAVRQFPESPLAAKATFRMAEIHYRQGNYLKAVFLSRKIARQHPDAVITPWALHLHGKGLLAAQKDAAGLHVLAGVVREYADHPVLIAAKTSLVAHHMERGDDPSALAQVRDVPQKKITGDRELGSLYGELLVRMQRTREARDVLEILVNRYPEDPRASRWMALLGDAYRADGKKREAMKVYYEVKTQFPESEGSLMARAGILDLRVAEDARGAFDQADRGYSGLVTETAGAFEGLALVRKASMLFRTGHYGRAVADYQHFLSDFGGSRYVRPMKDEYRRALQAYLGSLYEQQDFSEILELAQTHRAALSGEAWSAEVGWLLAESHRRMSFYRAALRSLDRLRREDDRTLRDDAFVARLAEVYLALGEVEAARKTLKHFVKRFPRSRHRANVHAMEARMAFLQGDDVQAVRKARLSLTGEQPERSDTIRFLLGAARWRQGKREESLAQFRQALPPAAASESAPLPPAVAGPARFAVADLLYELGRYREALSAYQAAMESHPDDRNVPWAQYRIGRVQWRLHRNTEALKTFEAIGGIPDETLALLVEDAKEELLWQQNHGRRP